MKLEEAIKEIKKELKNVRVYTFSNFVIVRHPHREKVFSILKKHGVHGYGVPALTDSIFIELEREKNS